MNNVDTEYLRVLQHIRDNGYEKGDRTGTGTKSDFGFMINFNMKEGFPILTTKRVHFHSIKVELLWFLGSHMSDERYSDLGLTNIRYLIDNDVSIWNEWPWAHYVKTTGDDVKMDAFVEKVKTDDDFAKKWGTIGSGYGKQWMDWNGYTTTSDISDFKDEDDPIWGGMDLDSSVHVSGINQIDKVIELLLNNPDSRRIIVSAWNVSEIEDMVLPPCHYCFQFYTRNASDEERAKYGKDKMISLMWNQRSCDYFLGIPFNISSYALLLSMVAQVVDMQPDMLKGSLGDTHLYLNHLDQADKQLSREVKDSSPNLWMNEKVENITDFTIDDIDIQNYTYQPGIKAPIAI